MFFRPHSAFLGFTLDVVSNYMEQKVQFGFWSGVSQLCLGVGSSCQIQFCFSWIVRGEHHLLNGKYFISTFFKRWICCLCNLQPYIFILETSECLFDLTAMISCFSSVHESGCDVLFLIGLLFVALRHALVFQMSLWLEESEDHDGVSVSPFSCVQQSVSWFWWTAGGQGYF